VAWNSLLGWVFSLLTNVLGLFYSSSSMTLGAGTYNGMLDVTNGNLTISGTVTLTAPAGYPALVVSKQILMSPGAKLIVNGMVYAGTGIGSAAILGSAGSSITINGGLMMPAPGNIPSQYAGTLSVTFNPTYASIPNFTTYAPCLTPQSVKLISWTP
jgi:hypothetical protein